MIDEVIIHIGMHKTGSSSIQASLQGFSTDGFHYADLGKPNHSIAMSSAFMTNPHKRRVFIHRGYSPARVQELAENQRARLISQIEEKNGTLIISGEDMSRFNVAAVTNLSEFFRTRGIKVRILGYARSPKSFAVSSMQQIIVKAGSKKAELPAPNYKRRFGPYFKIFGADAVEIRKFDPASFREKSVVQDFLDWCGIAPERVTEVRTNERFSHKAVGLIYRFNTRGPLAIGTDLAYTARKRLVSQVLKKFDGEPFHLPSNIPVCDEEIHDDVAWLNKRAEIEFGLEGVVADNSDYSSEIDEYLNDIAHSVEPDVQSHLNLIGVKTHSRTRLDELMTFWYYHCLSKNAKIKNVL